MDVKTIKNLIDTDNIHPFYVSSAWRRLRKEILAADKNECQCCKAKGRYAKANHVHHVNHVDKFPELALSKTYIGNGKEKRNLISVCKDCHETVCHPERMRQYEYREPLTEERW